MTPRSVATRRHLPPQEVARLAHGRLFGLVVAAVLQVTGKVEIALQPRRVRAQRLSTLGEHGVLTGTFVHEKQLVAISARTSFAAA